jgi:hypothetical protein
VSKTPIFSPAIMRSHTAVLGKTGSGKTSTTKLLVEQAYHEGARVCVLDTQKSDWWGLTTFKTGTSAFLPFLVAGGPYGHVPVHSAAGAAIAKVVATGEMPHSIIDMSEFEAGGVQRFFVDFAPVLMRHMRGVLYLVIEEAHELAPKERAGFGAENMAIHYAKKFATGGRSKGIRLVVCSQRVQALHNAILGSCETMIAHRLTAPADQEPVLKWFKGSATKEAYAQVAETISKLKTGEAWVFNGDGNIFERRQFPLGDSFDNTKTPEHDSKAGPQHAHYGHPKLDISQLKALIGDVVKEAEAKDPEKLKAENAELRKQLLAAQVRPIGPTVAELKESRASGFQEGVDATLRKAVTQLLDTTRDYKRSIMAAIDAVALPIADLRAPTPAEKPTTHTETKSRHEQFPPSPRTGNGAHRASSLPSGEPADSPELDGLGQRILDALAWLSAKGIEPAARATVAAVAGVKPSGGYYSRVVGSLKVSGYIKYPTNGELALTELGQRHAKVDDTSGEVHEQWLKILSGLERKIAEVLIERNNVPMTRDELAAATATDAAGGYFSRVVGHLKTLRVLYYPQTGQVALTRYVMP